MHSEAITVINILKILLFITLYSFFF
jgi:hypothetical protein